jgi:anti-anti-sigma factor
MEITEQATQGAWVVMAAVGRADAHTAAQFEAALANRIQAGAGNLAVDLSQVPFMSSAGLRGLLTALKLLQKKGGKMALVKPQENVMEVLEMSGFDGIFAITHDLQTLV